MTVFAMVLSPDPAHVVGMGCPECERLYGLSHLGTCSGSMMHGGAGIVGFCDRDAAERMARRDFLGRLEGCFAVISEGLTVTA